MDRIDRDLLAFVQRDGRMPYAELGRLVGLSAAAVHERLHKLSASGALVHWSAVVDPEPAGLPVLAFVRVLTDMPANARHLADTIADLPDVMEIHHTGGEWNCLVKIRAATPDDLERLVSERIAPHAGVLRVQIERVLSSAKESHIVPTQVSDSAV